MPGDTRFTINSEVNIAWCATHIFGIMDQGNTTSIIMYGEQGSSAAILFSTHNTSKIITGGPGLIAFFQIRYASKPGLLGMYRLNTVLQPAEKKFASLHVSQVAEKTWFIHNEQTPLH